MIEKNGILSWKISDLLKKKEKLAKEFLYVKLKNVTNVLVFYKQNLSKFKVATGNCKNLFLFICISLKIKKMMILIKFEPNDCNHHIRYIFNTFKVNDPIIYEQLKKGTLSFLYCFTINLLEHFQLAFNNLNFINLLYQDWSQGVNWWEKCNN